MASHLSVASGKPLLLSGGQWGWSEGPWEWHSLSFLYVDYSVFRFFVFPGSPVSKHIFRRVIVGRFENFKLLVLPFFSLPIGFVTVVRNFPFFLIMDLTGLLGHNLAGIPHSLGLSAVPRLGWLPGAGAFLFWAFWPWDFPLDFATGISILSLTTVFRDFHLPSCKMGMISEELPSGVLVASAHWYLAATLLHPSLVAQLGITDGIL